MRRFVSSLILAGFGMACLAFSSAGVAAPAGGAWQRPSAGQAPPAQNSQAIQQQSAPGQPQGSQAQTAPGQAKGTQGPPTGPQVTPEEAKAAQAIESELDPNKVIQLAQDFEKKYPTSPYLTDVYFFVANAYQQKNQISQAIDYGRKSLKAHPDNIRSLIMLTGLLPQPQDMQGSDQDKEARLKETEADASQALELIQKLPKPPSQTDDQFQKLKANVIAQIHSSLGMVHLQRATMALAGVDQGELAKAEAEYKQSVSEPQPSPQDYYRLGEVYRMESKLDEAIDAFTKAGQLGQGSGIDQLAQKQVDTLKAAKAKPAASH